MEEYDRSQVVVELGGVRLEGFAEGTRITVEPYTPPSPRRSVNRSGTIELTMTGPLSFTGYKGRLVPASRYWTVQRPSSNDKRMAKKAGPRGRAWRAIKLDAKRMQREALAEIIAERAAAVALDDYGGRGEQVLP